MSKSEDLLRELMFAAGELAMEAEDIVNYEYTYRDDYAPGTEMVKEVRAAIAKAEAWLNTDTTNYCPRCEQLARERDELRAVIEKAGKAMEDTDWNDAAIYLVLAMDNWGEETDNNAS